MRYAVEPTDSNHSDFSFSSACLTYREIGHSISLKIGWEKKRYHPTEYIPRKGPFRNCTFVLDGTECYISEPIEETANHAYKSGKAHGHTVKYEAACHISSSRIMWISGGVSGAIHDKTVLRGGGLLNILPQDQRGLADKGYICAEWSHFLFCPIPPYERNGNPELTLGEELYNTNLSSLRVEIERVFGRMKNSFKVLQHSRDRNLYRHRLIFVVLAHTFNIWNEFEPIRAEVNQYILNPPDLPVPSRANRPEELSFPSAYPNLQ